jgi:positive regulator of sigma E activity
VVKIKNDKDLVEGSFLVYLLPGLMFLVGMFAGGWVGTNIFAATGDGEILAQLAGGVIGLGFSFVFAKLQMLIKGTERFVPEVTNIIRRAEPPDQVIHSAS